MLLSIIIPNYNYEHFVGQAIESALALAYAPKEIIVVDDGSTDQSREVIEGYVRLNPETVRMVTKPNGGLSSAVNAGFAEASGALVYMLDADDLVDQSMMKEVAPLFRHGVSKVQFFMEVIDADAKFVWYNKPAICAPEEIRKSVLHTGIYPTPTTSGNVYSMAFLRQVMPISPEEIWADAALCLLAPLYGEVVSIEKPLGKYRQHGTNMNIAGTDITAPMRKHIHQTDLRDAMLELHCQRLNIPLVPNTKDRDQIALTRRLISVKLRPDLHPIVGDHLLGVYGKAVTAVLLTSWLRWKQRVVVTAWMTVFALGPRTLAWELGRMRLIPSYRPKLLINCMRMLRAKAGAK